MESKTERGGKLSFGSTNKKNSKYRKIMNHITTALHYTKNSPSVSKRASEIHLEDPQCRDSVAGCIEVEDIKTIPDIQEILNESTDDPIYSAIHPFKNIEPRKEENCSPPLPPKNLEDLYAKVKKKKVIDYCRNGLNLQHENSAEVNGSCSNQIENTEPKTLSCTTTDILSDEMMKDSTEMCSIETKVDELHTWKILKRQQHKKRSVKLKSIDDKQLLCSFLKSAENVREQEQTQKKESHSSNIPFTHQFNRYSKSPHRKMDDMHASLPVKHKEDNYKKALQEHQADLWNFQQKLEYIVDENKSLHEYIHTLLDNEAKWNVEMANLIQYKNENNALREKNSHLMQDLYSVEEKNRKEVKILSDKIHQLQGEKGNLLDKLHSVLHENKDLETNLSEITKNYTETISIQTHLEKLQVNHRELEVSKKKYKEELDRMLESYQTAEKERALLSIQVQDLKDEIFKLQQDNQALKDSQQEATKSKNFLLSHLEESKAYSYETQNLIASLLKVAEAITSERDIAVTKSHFQDYHHKKMEDSVVEHTIGIGRLQEHMLNIKKKANEEIRKIGASCTNFEIASVKNYYERQIKFLKETVMQKNEMIMSLDSEKKNLEADLQTLQKLLLVKETVN